MTKGSLRNLVQRAREQEQKGRVSRWSPGFRYYRVQGLGFCVLCFTYRQPEGVVKCSEWFQTTTSLYLAAALAFRRFSDCPGELCYRGVNDCIYMGVPYYEYSIMGPKTPCYVRAPARREGFS